MQVMVGWSGETERNVWHKHDVTLGDADLDSFGNEYGFVPGDTTSRWRYSFLENEATLRVCAWVARVSEHEVSQAARERVKECVDRREQLLERTR